jgi:hypothetical protein
MLREATGSPKGLRGSRDADDPMNLIRVIPAEGGARGEMRRHIPEPVTIR